MKRILYVHHCSTLGGASLSMLYLIQQIDRERYEPIVLFNSLPGQVVDLFQAQGIEIYRDDKIGTYGHGQGTWLSLRSTHPLDMFAKALQIKASAKRFHEFLRKHPVDLVHLNSMVQVPAALGAKWAKIPLVWHIREELHPGYLGIRRTLLRRLIKSMSDATIVISHRNAAQLIPDGKLHVIYNFLDFEHFDRNISPSQFRQEQGLLDNQPVVGMLGGVVKHKGVDIFVEAASLVHQHRPDVVFLIAGVSPQNDRSPSRLKHFLRRCGEEIGFLDNPERKALSTIRTNHLEDAVRFIGMRSDVPEMLAACKMIVWPASASHFARPIIEAGAMARPVIASDFPSSRELVQPDQTGILYPPGDATALAFSIMYMLENPEKASRMGEAGYVLARQRYDARVNAAATFAVYEEVLTKHSSRMP